MRVRLLTVSGDRPFLRSVLLLLVFAGTAAAFWWHFERRMAHIAPAPAVQAFLADADGLLAVDEARALHRWRAVFKDGLGMPVQVLLTPGVVQVPTFAPGTLFVGAGLGKHAADSAVPGVVPQAVVVLPPLARKALGEGPRLSAEEELASCLRTHAPAPCLEKTLSTLWRHLGGQ